MTQAAGKQDHRRGPRPHLWKTGPSLFRHQQYRAYKLLQVRCTYRREQWSLTFDYFEKIWTPQLWSQRGLQATELVLGRIDPGRGWHNDNVKIRTCYDNQMHHYRAKDRLGLPRSYRFKGTETAGEFHWAGVKGYNLQGEKI
jgi:hypothetical protein